MPTGYVILTEKVTDAARFEAYGAKALPTVFQHGGAPLAVHDDAEVLEGRWHGSRTIILEFPSVEAARAWYHSPEYQAIVGERQAAAECNVVIVGGYSPLAP